jgi:uncharacterized protein involved in outer membrane biogenesis
MGRLGKIIGWIAGIIVLIIILAIAGVAIFFPKEKAKAMAIEKISAALERRVIVDGVSVSFWGGIGVSLDGIKISNPDGFQQGEFLSAKALDVKVSFFPLFRKEVQIARLILKDPRISLHKLADGHNNYKFGAVEEVASAEVNKALSDETKAAAMAISFDNLTIENGQIDYVDDSTLTRATIWGAGLKTRMIMPSQNLYNASGSIQIDSIRAATALSKLPLLSVTADYNMKLDLNAHTLVVSNTKIDINGIKLNVNAGIPNLQTMSFFNAEISSEEADLANLISLLPDSAKAMMKGFDVTGMMALKANFKYNKNSQSSLNYDGQADLKDLKLSKSGSDGQATIGNASVAYKNNFIDVDVKQGKADLSLLNQFLPKTGNPLLSGDMQFDLSIRGPLGDYSQMKLSGNIDVKDGKYTAAALPEPIQSFAMKIALKPEQWTISNMQVKFVTSDFTLSGNLRDPFPYILPKYAKSGKKPYLTFQLKSQRFDTDKLFPEAVPGSGVNRAELPADSLPPLILPDIEGSGDGAIDTLIYSKVEFTKINCNFTIKDRKIFVNDAKGAVYTGGVTGETEIDLNDFNNPIYSGKFDASQIEANDFLTRFTNFGGHLYGKLNMKGTFSASGWEPEPLMNSLTMDGLALVNEARLENLEILKQMAQTLNLKTFDKETLKDLATAVKIENGRVVFDGMKFFSQTGDWNIAGSVGFDGTLDYIGEVLLTDKVSASLTSQPGLTSSVASLFKDSSGRIKVPFRLGGSYSKPKISIDMGVKDKLKDKVKGKLDNAIQNFLKKK